MYSLFHRGDNNLVFKDILTAFLFFIVRKIFFHWNYTLVRTNDKVSDRKWYFFFFCLEKNHITQY